MIYDKLIVTDGLRLKSVYKETIRQIEGEIFTAVLKADRAEIEYENSEGEREKILIISNRGEYMRGYRCKTLLDISSKRNAHEYIFPLDYRKVI